MELNSKTGPNSRKNLIAFFAIFFVTAILLALLTTPKVGEATDLKATTTVIDTTTLQETQTEDITEVQTEKTNDDTLKQSVKTTVETTAKHKNTRNTSKISHDGENLEVTINSKSNAGANNSPIKNSDKESTLTETIVSSTIPNIADNSTIKPYYPLYKCEKPKNEIVKSINSNPIYVGDSDFMNFNNNEQQNIIDVLAIGFPNNTYNVGNTKAYEATYAALMFAGFGEVYSGQDEAIKYAYNEIIKHIGDNASQEEINTKIKVILFDNVDYQLVNF